MTKKGMIQEIFSKALFADNPRKYQITYRDFEFLREESLLDFIKESEDFGKIPASRIILIKKNNKILFRKKIVEI